jgi:Lon protease-like protein
MDVALFPIPNSVSFPGVPCPLHVFEPRYRQMVRHCLEEDLFMGVCHTEKVLRNNSREQTLEEALSSNQSTYKPREVFSAGPVELMDELPDGRLMITVRASVRLVLQEERQTLPFSIWRCRELVDAPGDGQALQALQQSKEKILTRLLAITHGHDEVQAQLRSDHWQQMSPLDFSFAAAGMLVAEPELAQQLLETTDTQHRLDVLLELINTAS